MIEIEAVAGILEEMLLCGQNYNFLVRLVLGRFPECLEIVSLFTLDCQALS